MWVYLFFVIIFVKYCDFVNFKQINNNNNNNNK